MVRAACALFLYVKARPFSPFSLTSAHGLSLLMGGCPPRGGRARFRVGRILLRCVLVYILVWACKRQPRKALCGPQLQTSAVVMDFT